MVNSDNKVVPPIDPHGLSGGAVWRLGDLPAFENGTNIEKFVAIGMEYRHEALVAVRISLVLETMRSLFGDLSAAIPLSQWIGVSVREA